MGCQEKLAGSVQPGGAQYLAAEVPMCGVSELLLWGKWGWSSLLPTVCLCPCLGCRSRIVTNHCPHSHRNCLALSRGLCITCGQLSIP